MLLGRPPGWLGVLKMTAILSSLSAGGGEGGAAWRLVMGGRAHLWTLDEILTSVYAAWHVYIHIHIHIHIYYCILHLSHIAYDVYTDLHERTCRLVHASPSPSALCVCVCVIAMKSMGFDAIRSNFDMRSTTIYNLNNGDYFDRWIAAAVFNDSPLTTWSCFPC